MRSHPSSPRRGIRFAIPQHRDHSFKLRHSKFPSPLIFKYSSHILQCSISKPCLSPHMETKTTSVPVPAAEDLIEEKKPTSLLIAQFFLFPLIIIGICVGIFLLFGYLTYEQKTPGDYLRDVQTGSDLCCRWQAAYELSNIISSNKEAIRKSEFV